MTNRNYLTSTDRKDAGLITVLSDLVRVSSEKEAFVTGGGIGAPFGDMVISTWVPTNRWD